MNNHSNYMD